MAAAFTSTAPANAWVEAHVTADDVRLSLDRGGHLEVEHRIALKIAGGPLRSLDVRGVEDDAVPQPDGYAVLARDAERRSLDSALPIETEMVDAGDVPSHDGPPRRILRIRFDGKGLSRGSYVVLVKYATHWTEQRVDRDGPLSRIRWQGAVWDDGLDSARVTFVLPAAPTEPRPDDDYREDHDDADGTAALPATFLSSVRRGPEKDELELVRPYAPKGEPIVWAIRVDARGLRTPDAPVVAKSEPLAPVMSFESTGGTLFWVVAGGILLAYALLVAAKCAEVSRHARAAGVSPRPLVRLPAFVRAAGAGIALTTGLVLEAQRIDATAGALLVAVAAALAAHRTPLPARTAPSGASLRKPGSWLPVSESEGLQGPPRPKGALLDASTRGGKVLLFFLLAAACACAALVSRFSMHHATLIGLDSVVFLAIFCTGRLNELPPDPALAPAKLLREVAKRVRAKVGASNVKAVARLRIPSGQADADEVRLQLVPATPVAGLRSIEVGVVFAHGAGGWIQLPEVLVRIVSGSPCDKAVASLVRFGRTMRGRKPDETVILFTPRFPTAKMTAGIVAALVARVVDKSPPKAARSPTKKRAA